MCGSTLTKTRTRTKTTNLTLADRNGLIDDVGEIDGLSNVVYFWD